MENFIHRENLLLFKKRLAESHDATTHQVLLKLLADEEAKDVHLPSKAEALDAAPDPELANMTATLQDRHGAFDSAAGSGNGWPLGRRAHLGGFRSDDLA